MPTPDGGFEDASSITFATSNKSPMCVVWACDLRQVDDLEILQRSVNEGQ